jgi:multiple sugar transport system ATP-binding protein
MSDTGGVRKIARLYGLSAELMVLVGPSGCGKSTLLRLVAGLEAPTSGTIRLDGRVVNDLRPQERNVAMVFQDYALYPYLSARRNLEFPLRMRKLSRRQMRERVERVAGLLGLSSLLERYPPGSGSPTPSTPHMMPPSMSWSISSRC